MRAIHCVVVFAVSCALGACDDRDPPVPPDLSGIDPIVLDDHMVFVAGKQKQAFLLDLSETRPKAETTRFELPPQANTGARRQGEGNNEALILCAGERESAQGDAEPAALVAINGTGERRVYELGTTAFNTLTQSDDGRWAIAYRNGTTQDRTLDNPNELAVVDLERAPDDDAAVTLKTPAGLGHTLTNVLVSPTMNIADEDRRLLVLLSSAEVSMFDLNHLDRRATIVQLDERRSVDPTQIVFSADQPTLYVRANSSDNIFMFRFEPFSNTDGGNDFQPSINPLGGGSNPSDLALFGSGTAERLLVVASRQALVIDPATSKTTPVPLSSSPDKILLFDGTSPQDASVKTHALLYSKSGEGLTFLDVEAIGDAPGDSVEVVTSEQSVEQLIPLLDEKTVVLVQPSLVSVLDLQDRTLTPISSNRQLTDAAVFDPGRKKLWVGPSGSPYVQSLELATGRTGDELRLDAPIRRLVPMFSKNRLVVLHDESLGYLTLVDADQPDRDHALSLRGFFVNLLFDRSGS